MIFVVIGNRSVDTTGCGIATINSTNFIIITNYIYRDTTNFRITPRIFTFVTIVITSRRSISYHTSILSITVSLMARIWSYTRRRNILKYASHIRAARIFSTSIMIIAYYIFIFARI
jgi:hypothetical protein